MPRMRINKTCSVQFLGLTLDYPELLHHGHIFDKAPMLYGLAIIYAHDVDLIDLYFLSGSRDSHELTLVGPRSGVVAHYKIAFSNEKGDRATSGLERRCETW